MQNAPSFQGSTAVPRVLALILLLSSSNFSSHRLLQAISYLLWIIMATKQTQSYDLGDIWLTAVSKYQKDTGHSIDDDDEAVSRA